MKVPTPYKMGILGCDTPYTFTEILSLQRVVELLQDKVGSQLSESAGLRIDKMRALFLAIAWTIIESGTRQISTSVLIF